MPEDVELTSAANTLVVGSVTLTVSVNGSGFLQGITAANNIGFCGTIYMNPSPNSLAGTSSLSRKGSISGGPFLPLSAGGSDLGSTLLPHANLWLGTAATNNFKFQPAATAAARVVNIADPLNTSFLGLSLNTTNGLYQSKRAVAGCTTAASIGGICASDITITWTTAFADANYSVTCTGNTPTNVPSGPFIVSGTKLAATVHINYFAITAAAASYATIDCNATHD